MGRRTLSVAGLSCTGCEENVTDALTSLAGVTDVDADHESDTVELVADESVTDEDIHAAIEGAGYEVTA